MAFILLWYYWVMTLDIKTIPPVVIEPGTYGEITIESNENYFFLKQGDVIWHQYTVPNMREYWEQVSGYDLAYGDVLLSGFGFGQMATWLANKPEVTSITVIEKNIDVVNAFLKNNSMPKNVNIIIDDANTFSTDTHYNCVIWDHIPNGAPKPDFYKQLCNNAKSISHDLFWFWSIEFYYLRYYYGFTWEHLYIYNVNFNEFDFSRSWEKMRQVLNVPTIPSLPKNKIDYYINSYFMK